APSPASAASCHTATCPTPTGSSQPIGTPSLLIDGAAAVGVAIVIVARPRSEINPIAGKSINSVGIISLTERIAKLFDAARGRPGVDTAGSDTGVPVPSAPVRLRAGLGGREPSGLTLQTAGARHRDRPRGRVAGGRGVRRHRAAHPKPGRGVAAGRPGDR